MTDDPALDWLTGLPNRNAATAWIAAHQGQPGTAVLLDICGFVYVTDEFGYLAADEVLKQVARALTAATPPEALLARIGGDEFLVLEATTADPAPLADEMTAAAQLVTIPSAKHLAVTTGTATGPVSEDLIRDADAALYATRMARLRRT
jgi:diguanylate cyclase (GGDEF)-like protein